MASEVFRAVVDQARTLRLLSDEHFTVDGTLVEVWASLKSFKRKDAGPSGAPDDPGNPTVNFRGERRSNATHQSTTDPEATLARKGAGKEAKLCYSANALMEEPQHHPDRLPGRAGGSRCRAPRGDRDGRRALARPPANHLGRQQVMTRASLSPRAAPSKVTRMSRRIKRPGGSATFTTSQSYNCVGFFSGNCTLADRSSTS